MKNSDLMFDDKELFPKVKVNCKVDFKIGKPANILFNTEISGKKFNAKVSGDTCQAARTKAITSDDITAHIDRLGSTPFVLDDIEISLDDNLGMGFSMIHNLRSKCLEQLKENILNDYRFTDTDNEVIDVKDYKPVKGKNKVFKLAALVTNPDNARISKKKNIENIYVSAINYKRGYANNGGAYNNISSCGYPKSLNIAMPTINHDNISPSIESKWDFQIEDFIDYSDNEKAYLCDNLSSLIKILGAGLNAEVGPHIPIVNKHSVEFMASLGVKRIWLSPELSIKQISDLTSAFPDISFGLLILGPTELMITEHCVLMSEGSCAQNCVNCIRRKNNHYLVDRMGYKFPVLTDPLGRSHIYNSINLDLCHSISELIDAGIDIFMVDTTLMNAEMCAHNFGRLSKALTIALSGDRMDKDKKSTTGHMFREVE